MGVVIPRFHHLERVAGCKRFIPEIQIGQTDVLIGNIEGQRQRKMTRIMIDVK